jgi:hypothetical protein
MEFVIGIVAGIFVLGLIYGARKAKSAKAHAWDVRSGVKVMTFAAVYTTYQTGKELNKINKR